MSTEFSWPTATVGMGFLSFLDRLERRGRRVVRRSRGSRVECRAPRLCRFVPNRVTRRRPNRVTGTGVAYVAGHGPNDAGWKGRHRRPAAARYTELVQRTLRQRRLRLIPAST